MRKCFVCKQRIPLGDVAHPYPMDEVDRYILGLRDTRMMLYFHQHHYMPWLKEHAVERQRVRLVRGVPRRE